MYRIDKKDRVVPLDEIPSPDAGAPMPMLAASDLGVTVAYIVEGPPTSWDPAELENPAFDEKVAVVTFQPVSFMFGNPNNEAISAHPLYRRGLRPHGAFEVVDSSWVRALERMNRVHYVHSPEIFLTNRHFIITFHDSTLECVAREFRVTFGKGRVVDACRSAMDRLALEG